MNENDHHNRFSGDSKLMSLWEHLGELRYRIIVSLGCVLVFFLIGLGFSNELLLFLKGPLVDALPHVEQALHFTGPMDVLMVSMKVSFLAAIVFASPVWSYQFWKFIEPALYEKERKYILPFVVMSVALFFAGIAFCFTLILPLCLSYLLSMGAEVGQPLIIITDYISLVTVMLFGFGIVFETPLILVLLASLGLVDAKILASHRRGVVVACLIIGALLTPPDPLSQMAMAIPLYVMYEISILVIRLLIKTPRTRT